MESSVASTVGLASGCVLTLVWLVVMVRFARSAQSIPVLRAGTTQSPAGAASSLSVIVAAKDEEQNIEACVRSILTQDHPRLDLVVVDDRSVDGTPRILQRLRGEFGDRLTVLTVERLPDGWGGQNHALHQGVRSSTGEWICFTDADCRLESRDALTVAAGEATARRADLLSIVPRVETPSAWEKVYLPLCCLVFMMRLRIGDVNQADRPAAYANGAFLLVRRTAYVALGGHESVRGRLNDDVALARVAKGRGLVVRIAGNSDLLRTRMYTTPRQAWDGWTRNFVGALETPQRLAGTVGLTFGLFLLPWLLFVTCAGMAATNPAWRAAAGSSAAAVIASHVGLWLAYAALKCPPAGSLLYPPAALFIAAIAVRALRRTWRRSHTVWQGARYRG